MRPSQGKALFKGCLLRYINKNESFEVVFNSKNGRNVNCSLLNGEEFNCLLRYLDLIGVLSFNLDGSEVEIPIKKIKEKKPKREKKPKKEKKPKREKKPKKITKSRVFKPKPVEHIVTKHDIEESWQGVNKEYFLEDDMVDETDDERIIRDDDLFVNDEELINL